MSKHALTIINKIAAAKTVKEKDCIIYDNRINGMLKCVVYHALNTAMSFHIKELDYYPPKVDLFSGNATPDNTSTFYKVVEMLSVLNDKGGCSGNDKMIISQVYSLMDKDYRDLIDIILSRKVQCGAGLSKFRKVWGDDFLPDFPCYLSSAFNEGDILKNIFNASYAVSEVKSDGQRCMALVRKSGIKLHSRNGKQYIGLHKIERELNKFVVDPNYAKEYMLDGELVLLDDDGNIMPRAIGNGKIGKAIKGTMTSDVSNRVVFIIWDIVPMDEFDGKIPLGDPRKNKYMERLAELSDAFSNYLDVMDSRGVSADNSILRQQEGRIVKNIGEAMHHYAEMVLRGEEGTILKAIYGEWEPCHNKKRPTTQYKFKEVFEADFRIVGWYKGKKGGKYQNAIGGFNIVSECGNVVANCGGGLSDDIRFSDDPDGFIREIINVEYNGRSKAEGRETFSLTHPRATAIGVDKDAADTLERIIEQEESTREMKRVMGQ